MSLHKIIVNSVEAHGRASKELIIDINRNEKNILTYNRIIVIDDNICTEQIIIYQRALRL